VALHYPLLRVERSGKWHHNTGSFGIRCPLLGLPDDAGCRLGDRQLRFSIKVDLQNGELLVTFTLRGLQEIGTWSCCYLRPVGGCYMRGEPPYAA